MTTWPVKKWSIGKWPLTEKGTAAKHIGSKAHVEKEMRQKEPGQMFKLGLTGSIATGKSTVLAMFARQGCAVFSADEQVHRLYEQELVPHIREFYPRAVSNDRVDRKILGAYLFEHPDRLHQLEKIIHPLVRQRLVRFMSRSREQGNRLAVADIPLLLENRSAYELDAVAVTVCDIQEQKRRALARPGMTPEKLQAILARQMPQEEKARLADFVIDTQESLEHTEHQVRRIIEQCLAR